jgi:hypothetical protein
MGWQEVVADGGCGSVHGILLSTHERSSWQAPQNGAQVAVFEQAGALTG